MVAVLVTLARNVSDTKLTPLMIIGFYAIAACGVNVLVGRLGLITIGHAATVGLAAFVSVHLMNDGHSFLVSSIGGVVVSTVIGLPLVLVSFRLDGLFFGIVSLAYLVVTMSVLHLFKPLSGGPEGVVTPPIEILGHSMYDYRNAAILVGIITGVALGAGLFAARTATGLQWDAIRSSPAAAEALGISVVRVRISGYLVGSAIGGIAGPVYAIAVGALTTDQFGLRMSLAFLLISVIGSPKSLVIGPLLGSTVYVMLPDFLQSVSGSSGDAPMYAQMLLSVVILLLLVVGYSRATAHLRAALDERLSVFAAPLRQRRAATNPGVAGERVTS